MGSPVFLATFVQTQQNELINSLCQEEGAVPGRLRHQASGLRAAFLMEEIAMLSPSLLSGLSFIPWPGLLVGQGLQGFEVKQSQSVSYGILLAHLTSPPPELGPMATAIDKGEGFLLTY
jgi:hypothetical protein